MGYDEGYIEFTVKVAGANRDGLLERKADGTWEVQDVDDDWQVVGTLPGRLAPDILVAMAKGMMMGYEAGYRFGLDVGQRRGEVNVRSAIKEALGL